MNDQRQTLNEQAYAHVLRFFANPGRPITPIEQSKYLSEARKLLNIDAATSARVNQQLKENPAAYDTGNGMHHSQQHLLGMQQRIPSQQLGMPGQMSLPMGAQVAGPMGGQISPQGPYGLAVPPYSIPQGGMRPPKQGGRGAALQPAMPGHTSAQYMQMQARQQQLQQQMQMQQQQQHMPSYAGSMPVQQAIQGVPPPPQQVPLERKPSKKTKKDNLPPFIGLKVKRNWDGEWWDGIITDIKPGNNYVVTYTLGSNDEQFETLEHQALINPDPNLTQVTTERVDLLKLFPNSTAVKNSTVLAALRAGKGGKKRGGDDDDD